MPDQRRHIVLLIDCLLDLEGGAERQVYELARRLDAKKYKVTIASLECGGAVPENILKSAGCDLVRFPVKRIYGISGWREGIRFYRFLKEHRVDILMTYHFSSDIWGAFWGRRAGVPKIMSNRRDAGFWRGRHHIWAYRWINHWVAKIVVVANEVRDMVTRDEGYPREKVEVIYNGIEILPLGNEVPQDRRREDLGLGQEEIVIMYVGNLRPVKGHRFLLEAVAGFKEKVPSIRLILIGDGESRGELEDLSQRLNIREKVVFLGKCPNARRFLGAADICVLTSWSEGLSNAILEYMAAAKPVVATRVGGNPELVVDGTTGILVAPKDSEALRNALLHLIENPGERVRLGQAGLSRVRSEFSMEAMVGSYEKILSQ